MNQVSSVKQIAAVVTLNASQVGGGAPIFVVQSKQEQEQVSFLIGRLIDGMVHDLGNGVFIVVKH